MKKKNKGFTLVEVMTVVGIIAILMAAAIPTFIGARRRSEAKACKANLEIVRSAVKEWALDNPDKAVADHQITSDEITSYIEGGFSSLKCPSGTSYTYNLPKVNTDGSIPNPTCSSGLADHSL